MWRRTKAEEDSTYEKECQEEGYEPFAVIKENEEEYDSESCRYFTSTVIYIHYKKQVYDT